MNLLKITAHLVLAGLGGGLILWLGIWLSFSYDQGDTSITSKQIEERGSAPQQREFANLLNNLGGDWMRLEPWSGRSINFHAGAQSPNHSISPVLLVAVWVGLASLLFSLSWQRFPPSQFMTGLAIPFLIGWLALDIRWQRQLSSRLVETYERYGHLSHPEREKAQPDARIASAIDRVRQTLPEHPTRIIILSNDPNGYVINRIRYHLLPNRVYATSRLPSQVRVHQGDHILVMSQPEMAQYDQKQGLLMSGRASYAVDHLVTVPGIGALYRVSGGN